MDKKYIIVLFKNKKKRKIIKGYNTEKRAKKFFDEKVKLQGIQRDLSNSNRMMLISESLQSYREIRIYRLRDFILNAFNNTARKYENSQVFSQSVGLITKFAIEGLAFSILVIVLLWKK
jgi:hypothetical protein